MPDIHFECPKCNQSLDAPEELVGQLIECPSCNETIEIPIHSSPPRLETPMAPKPQHIVKNIVRRQPIQVIVEEQPIKVVVKDFEMSFDSMVMFMIKWALASIPALFILAVAAFIIFLIIGAVSRN
jgi:hypothetical protein